MMMYRIFMILFLVLLTECHVIPRSSQSLPTETQSKEKTEKMLDQQLIFSAEQGDTENVLQLLKDGADINATDKHGRTDVMAEEAKESDR